jgi:hypothetical protein
MPILEIGLCFMTYYTTMAYMEWVFFTQKLQIRQ